MYKPSVTVVSYSKSLYFQAPDVMSMIFGGGGTFDFDSEDNIR